MHFQIGLADLVSGLPPVVDLVRAKRDVGVVVRVSDVKRFLELKEAELV